jgi:hypothetical protein
LRKTHPPITEESRKTVNNSNDIFIWVAAKGRARPSVPSVAKQTFRSSPCRLFHIPPLYPKPTTPQQFIWDLFLKFPNASRGSLTFR